MSTARALREVVATEVTPLVRKPKNKHKPRRRRLLGDQHQSVSQVQRTDVVKALIDNILLNSASPESIKSDDIKLILKLSMLSSEIKGYVDAHKDAPAFNLNMYPPRLLKEIYTFIDHSLASHASFVERCIKARMKFEAKAQAYRHGWLTRFTGYLMGLGICNLNEDDRSYRRDHRGNEGISMELGACVTLLCLIPFTAAFLTVISAPSLIRATGRLAEMMGDHSSRANSTHAGSSFEGDPLARSILAAPFFVLYALAMWLAVSLCRSIYKFPYYTVGVYLDKRLTKNIDHTIFDPNLSSLTLDDILRNFVREMRSLQTEFNDLLKLNNDTGLVDVKGEQVSLMTVNGIFGRRPNLTALVNQSKDIEAQQGMAINI